MQLCKYLSCLIRGTPCEMLRVNKVQKTISSFRGALKELTNASHGVLFLCPETVIIRKSTN